MCAEGRKGPQGANGRTPLRSLHRRQRHERYDVHNHPLSKSTENCYCFRSHITQLPRPRSCLNRMFDSLSLTAAHLPCTQVTCTLPPVVSDSRKELSCRQAASDISTSWSLPTSWAWVDRRAAYLPQVPFPPVDRDSSVVPEGPVALS